MYIISFYKDVIKATHSHSRNTKFGVERLFMTNRNMSTKKFAQKLAT